MDLKNGGDEVPNGALEPEAGAGGSIEFTPEELQGMHAAAGGESAGEAAEAQPAVVRGADGKFQAAAAAAAVQPGAAAGQDEDWELPEAAGKRYGVRKLSELARRTQEYEQRANEYAGYGKTLFERYKALQTELAQLRGGGGAAAPAPAADPYAGTFYGFKDSNEFVQVQRNNPEQFAKTFGKYMLAQNLEYLRTEMGQQVEQRVAPLRETVEQRQTREREQQEVQQLEALDSHCRTLSSALFEQDPRFAPGGALHQQMLDWWQREGAWHQQRMMQDSSYNPFEYGAALITQRAGLGIENAKLQAAQKRLKQVGAAAATLRPGTGAAAVVKPGKGTWEEEARALQATLQAAGQAVDEDEVEAAVRVFGR